MTAKITRIESRDNHKILISDDT